MISYGFYDKSYNLTFHKGIFIYLIAIVALFLNGSETNISMFIFDKKSIRESKWEQKIIVHEIVVNLRIPPYTKKVV